MKGRSAGTQGVWTKAFTTIFVINVFNSLGFHILTPILPKYAVSLSLGDTLAGVIGTVFTVTSVMIRLLMIKMHMVGRYRMYLIASLSMIAVAIAGFAFSESATPLILFRLLHGVGWGICSTVAATLASLALPSDKVGAGIGLFGLGSVFGSAIAPNLGLNLVDAIGYQRTFLVALAMPLIGIALCLLLKNVEAGAVEAPGRPAASAIGWKEIDWRPLFPTLLIAIAVIPANGISSFIALCAQERGVEQIGFFFTVNAFALLFARPLFGRLSDRLEPWKLLIPAMIAYACVMVGLYFAQSLPVFLIIALVYALGYGSVNPTIQSWCVRSVEKRQFGMAQIIYYTGFDLGSGLGGLISGMIASAAGYSAMYLWLIIPIAVDLAILLVYRALQKQKVQKGAWNHA